MSGRRILVTGGAGDLGRACAEAWRKSGALVEAPGREQLDVADAASVQEWFAKHGSFDTLINCAGIADDALLARLNDLDLDRVLDVNLSGAWRCCREFAHARGGAMEGAHVVLIGSYAGRAGAVGQAAYAAAKAGLVGLVRSLAREWGAAGGRINLVLPGFMETRMTHPLSNGQLEAFRERHVLPNFSRPQEVAQFCVVLDAMPAVSGQVFQLDSRLGSA